MKFSSLKHIFQYCTLTLRKALKCIEMTPQKVQKIIHNIIIPQTYFFSDPPPPPQKKKMKFKILNLQKWTEPTYLW